MTLNNQMISFYANTERILYGIDIIGDAFLNINFSKRPKKIIDKLSIGVIIDVSYDVICVWDESLLNLNMVFQLTDTESEQNIESLKLYTYEKIFTESVYDIIEHLLYTLNYDGNYSLVCMSCDINTSKLYIYKSMNEKNQLIII